MKFKIHNKLEITSGGLTYTFFNTMLKSVYEKYSNLESFNDFISIGKGKPSESQNGFRLTNYLGTINLVTETIQSDISKGQLYVKKKFEIDALKYNGEYLTELGLSTNEEPATIYNYFSLITNEFPNGILKETNKKLFGTLYIYLEIVNDSELIFISGENKFINFILGEGLEGDLYASRSYNPSLSDNLIVLDSKTTIKYPCSFTFSSNDYVELTFTFDLYVGEVNEIILLVGDTPFARINLQNYYNFTEITDIFTPKKHYIVDLGKNVKNINSVINNETQAVETNFFIKNYASEFGQITLTPFKSSFNNSTSKYLSKDGGYIFFVESDKIYIYSNTNCEINEIDPCNLVVQEIKTICCIDNIIFIFSKIEPYLFAYRIENNTLVKLKVNLSNYSDLDIIKNALKFDIAKTANGEYMLGIIDIETKNGITLYLEFSNDTISYKSHIESDHSFSYILAITCNNFCDAKIMYCEEGEYSYNCRLVSHLADGSETDVYTSLAYHYTKDTKELYVRDRGVVVEKNVAPKIQIYHYPQVYQYLFDELDNEEDYFLSNNLLYLAVKKTDNTFHFYNLVGYNQATEFTNSIPSSIDQTQIQDIVFLKDTFLIFQNNNDKPIIACNLKETNTLLENVSSNECTYTVNYDKYHLLGENNEGVIAKFAVNITI